MARFSDYMHLVRFAHTIFAMPFAFVAFVYAWTVTDNSALNFWVLMLQVVLCMIFARNVAMGFNRWADWKIDKANPRTAGREIPLGIITPKNAAAFVAVNAVLFVAVTATINITTLSLSPVALVVIVSYSYCKRFTSLSHLVLGFSMAIAPVGAYIAVTGAFALEPCVLAALVMTWGGGFDIIYALQDRDFDRANGLHSVPATFSVRTSLIISMVLHLISILCLFWFALYCPQSWLLWTGCGVFVAIIAIEHLLVTPTRQTNIGIAFGTLNGLASVALAAFLIANFLIYR